MRWNIETSGYESERKLEIHFYTTLVDLDSKFGTTASEQLFWCIKNTTRWDIIKV